MALLHIEGFEGGGTTDATLRTYLERKYVTSLNAYTYWRSGRFSDVAIRLAATNYFILPIDNKKTIIVGFAFKTSDADGNYAMLLDLKESGTRQLGIMQANNTGELRILSGSGYIGTTSGLNLIADTWYYIEFKGTIDNTGSYELRVNGVNVLSNASVDTQTTANAYIDSVHFTCTTGSPPRFTFDDIYICDDAGARNNDFLGDMRVTRIAPNGAGSSTQFAPSAGANYECVDDGQTVDDDTTYVEDDTANQKDLYAYGDSPEIGDIAGIAIATEAKETDATDYTLKTVVKSDTTESDDAAQALTSDYKIKSRLLEDDPHTSAQWSLANFNAAEFGIKVG